MGGRNAERKEVGKERTNEETRKDNGRDKVRKDEERKGGRKNCRGDTDPRSAQSLRLEACARTVNWYHPSKEGRKGGREEGR